MLIVVYCIIYLSMALCNNHLHLGYFTPTVKPLNFGWNLFLQLGWECKNQKCNLFCHRKQMQHIHGMLLVWKQQLCSSLWNYAVPSDTWGLCKQRRKCPCICGSHRHNKLFHLLPCFLFYSSCMSTLWACNKGGGVILCGINFLQM